jgi:hypothetical protein
MVRLASVADISCDDVSLRQEMDVQKQPSKESCRMQGGPQELTVSAWVTPREEIPRTKELRKTFMSATLWAVAILIVSARLVQSDWTGILRSRLLRICQPAALFVSAGRNSRTNPPVDVI